MGIFSHGLLTPRSSLLNSFIFPKLGSIIDQFIEWGALAWLQGDSYNDDTYAYERSVIGSSNGEVQKGQSFLFDGSTYVALGSAVALIGDFKATAKFNFSAVAVAGNSFFGGTNLTEGLLYISNAFNPNTYINGVQDQFTYITLVADTNYEITYQRVGGNMTVTVENLSDGSIQSQLRVVETTTVTLRYLGTYGAGNSPFDGNLWDFKVYDANDTQVLYCPGTNAVGTAVPMLINGAISYGTLTGATLPDFYHEHTDGFGFNPNVLGYSERENLLTYSEELDNTAWNKIRATVTKNTTLAPNGELTGNTLLADDTEDTSHNIYDTTSVTLEDNTYYTHSVYLKYKDYQWIRLASRDKAGNIKYQHFDILNGVKGGVSGVGDIIDSSIEAAGYGWYRCSITTDSESGATAPIFYYYLASSSISITIAGNVEGTGTYLWGSHLHKTAASDEYVKTTSALIQGIQLANPIDTALDILGNTLQYPKPRLSAKYTGYTGTWDGTAYALMDSTVTSVGDFTIEFVCNPTSFAAIMCVVGYSTANAVRIITGGEINLYIAATGYSSTITLTAGVDNYVKIERIDGNYDLTITNLSTGITETETVTAVTTNFPLSEIGSRSVGVTQVFTGTINYIKIYNASDTLIHHWVCEDSETSESTMIYDVVGSNHATLTSATTPFFTTESEYTTYLMENGWRLSSDSYIPAKADGSAAADGNALTALPGQIRTIEPGHINMPQDAGLIYGDIVGQYGPDLVTNGTFDTDTSGWAAVNAAIAVDTARLKITPSAAWGYAQQRISGLTVGAVYRLTADGEIGTATQLQLWIGDGPSGLEYGTPTLTGDGSIDVTFTPLAPSGGAVWLSLYVNGSGADGFYDNVTVQEVLDPINYFFEPDGDQRDIEYDDLLPTYGAEELTNGDFSGWTTDDPDSWTVVEVGDGTSNITEDANGCQIISDGTAAFIAQTVLTATSDYNFNIIVETVTSGSIDITDGTATLLTIDAVGSYSLDFTATDTDFTIAANAGGCDIVVQDVRVREITGTGADINDQYFFSAAKGLAIYSEPQDAATTAKIEKAMKIT
jgi:hypothetical protein